MAIRAEVPWRADECCEGVACLLGGCVGARLVGIASPVGLARRNSSETDTRTFSAPYRTIAIPDCRGSASEGLAGGDDRNRGEEEREGQPEGIVARRSVNDEFGCGNDPPAMDIFADSVVDTPRENEILSGMERGQEGELTLNKTPTYPPDAFSRYWKPGKCRVPVFSLSFCNSCGGSSRLHFLAPRPRYSFGDFLGGLGGCIVGDVAGELGVLVEWGQQNAALPWHLFKRSYAT